MLLKLLLKEKIISKNNIKNQKWTVGWGVSSKCDLNCTFCYSKKFRSTHNNSEIDLKQTEKFLINNKDKIKSINFGTGEFFLAPHFFEMLQMCNNILPNASIAVTTNGAYADLSETIIIFGTKYSFSLMVTLEMDLTFIPFN